MKSLILLLIAVLSTLASAAPLVCEKAIAGETLETPPGFISTHRTFLARQRLQRFTQIMMDRFGADTGVFFVNPPNSMTPFVGKGFYIIAGGDYVGTALRRDELFDRGYSGGSLPFKIGAQSVFLLDSRDQRTQWRLAHDALAPFFNPTFVKNTYVPAVKTQAKEMAQEWHRRMQRRGTVQINDDMELYSLATAYGMLFGETLDRQTFLQFAEALDSVFMPHDEKESLAVRKELEAFVRPAMKRARAKFKGEDSSSSLIQHLLFIQQREALSDSWVMDQIITIYFAGQVTTKVMLNVAYYFLAEHPEWQAKLRDEYVQSSDVTQLPQMENFLNEILRLYPPVPIISRYTREDIKIGPYLIPKNNLVVVNMYAGFMREETFGPNPGSFNPDRWNSLNYKKTEFCPFGFGPRICIGQFLALTEAKLLLGETLKRYAFGLQRPFSPPSPASSGLLSVSKPLVLKLNELED